MAGAAIDVLALREDDVGDAAGAGGREGRGVDRDATPDAAPVTMDAADGAAGRGIAIGIATSERGVVDTSGGGGGAPDRADAGATEGDDADATTRAVAGTGV